MDIKDLLKDIADELAADGLATGVGFWDRLSADGGRTDQAKQAMARFGQNTINAFAFPAAPEEHHRAAAADLNTLINLGAATQIEARREAREYINRVYDRLFTLAESAIIVLL